VCVGGTDATSDSMCFLTSRHSPQSFEATLCVTVPYNKTRKGPEPSIENFVRRVRTTTPLVFREHGVMDDPISSKECIQTEFRIMVSHPKEYPKIEILAARRHTMHHNIFFRSSRP
jgi:hypothetical protein